MRTFFFISALFKWSTVEINVAMVEIMLSNNTGYKELLDWVKQEFKKEIKYITLIKYSERHFGSKIKVAWKSHNKKNRLIWKSVFYAYIIID